MSAPAADDPGPAQPAPERSGHGSHLVLIWALVAAFAVAAAIAGVVVLAVPESTTPTGPVPAPPASDAVPAGEEPDPALPGEGEEWAGDADGTLAVVVPSGWTGGSDTTVSDGITVVTFSSAPAAEFRDYGAEGMLVGVVPQDGPVSHDELRDELLGYVSSAGPRSQEQCNLQGLISIPGAGEERRPTSLPAEPHEDWIWEDWTECRNGLVENVYAFAAADAVVIVAVRTADAAAGERVLARAVATLDVQA